MLHYVSRHVQFVTSSQNLIIYALKVSKTIDILENKKHRRMETKTKLLNQKLSLKNVESKSNLNQSMISTFVEGEF